jgi:Uncharacterized protein conserved in bacteria (DUF2213)
MLALDRSTSTGRWTDADGRLRVPESVVSKAEISGYFGAEIPSYQALNLDPGRLYRLLRPAAELRKAAPSFRGVQLLSRHLPTSAQQPQRDATVGCVLNPYFEDPFLKAELVFWDAQAIERVEAMEAVPAGHLGAPAHAPRRSPTSKSVVGRLGWRRRGPTLARSAPRKLPRGRRAPGSRAARCISALPLTLGLEQVERHRQGQIEQRLEWNTSFGAHRADFLFGAVNAVVHHGGGDVHGGNQISAADAGKIRGARHARVPPPTADEQRAVQLANAKADATTHVEPALGGKWLELLSEIAPGLKRAAVMFNLETSSLLTYMRPPLETAARSLKVVPIMTPVHGDAEIETAITALGREPGGGLVVMPSPWMTEHRVPIILAAARNNIPAVYAFSYYARDGGCSPTEATR